MPANGNLFSLCIIVKPERGPIACFKDDDVIFIIPIDNRTVFIVANEMNRRGDYQMFMIRPRKNIYGTASSYVT